MENFHSAVTFQQACCNEVALHLAELVLNPNIFNYFTELSCLFDCSFYWTEVSLFVWSHLKKSAISSKLYEGSKELRLGVTFDFYDCLFIHLLNLKLQILKIYIFFKFRLIRFIIMLANSYYGDNSCFIYEPKRWKCIIHILSTWAFNRYQRYALKVFT